MEDFSKRNMQEFVRYIALGIWGLSTCITVAHSWNFKEDILISCAAVVSLVGVAVAIIKWWKAIKNKYHAD